MGLFCGMDPGFRTTIIGTRTRARCRPPVPTQNDGGGYFVAEPSIRIQRKKGRPATGLPLRGYWSSANSRPLNPQIPSSKMHVLRNPRASETTEGFKGGPGAMGGVGRSHYRGKPVGKTRTVLMAGLRHQREIVRFARSRVGGKITLRGLVAPAPSRRTEVTPFDLIKRLRVQPPSEKKKLFAWQRRRGRGRRSGAAADRPAIRVATFVEFFEQWFIWEARGFAPRATPSWVRGDARTTGGLQLLTVNEFCIPSLG